MRTGISHFWIGNFKNKYDFNNFFREDESYYDDEREIDEKYISEFAKSQDINWLEHDFLECGFEDKDISFEEKFSKYSYAEEWINELKKRMEQNRIDFQSNTIAFIAKDKIEKPVSIKKSDFHLIYLGEIEYKI